jgi:ribosomal protein S18 acetylase RimI-like enzyme
MKTQIEKLISGLEAMHPLDNVAWRSLTTRHAAVAVGNDQARRFIPEISTIGAVLEPNDRGFESLGKLVKSGESVNLALKQPYEGSRPEWTLTRGTLMPQMVYEGNGSALSAHAPADLEIFKHIVELRADDEEEMVELTSLTKPGPFARRTHELGRYTGIRRDGKLVAMAGERMKVPGYTEVSAICTHPDHTGRGYARILTTEIVRGILERGETPFLHVRHDNARAIALYERLGFRVRVVNYHAVLKRN